MRITYTWKPYVKGLYRSDIDKETIGKIIDRIINEVFDKTKNLCYSYHFQERHPHINSSFLMFNRIDGNTAEQFYIDWLVEDTLTIEASDVYYIGQIFIVLAIIQQVAPDYLIFTVDKG